MTKDTKPLDDLHSLLCGDMERVNNIIVERMDSEVELVPKVARHLVSSGGKRIRPLLTLACARMFGNNDERPCLLAAAVEFIHTATLLHDDVVDESYERRSNPSANAIFGNQASVLVGDFLFSRSFQLMVEDGSLDVLRILSNASAIISEGEVMQLMTEGNLGTSFDEYGKVISAKTAALFSASCEIGPIIAGKHEDKALAMKEFGTGLGIAFQIADDILDYNSSTEKLGKNVGDDFKKGKMTAPVILAISEADNEEKAFWKRTIVDLEQEDGDLAHAKGLFEKHGCFDKGMEIARGYADKAMDGLNTAPECEMREALADLLKFTTDREY